MLNGLQSLAKPRAQVLYFFSFQIVQDGAEKKAGDGAD